MKELKNSKLAEDTRIEFTVSDTVTMSCLPN